MNETTFPVAKVVAVPAPWYKRLSRMWFVTAICALLAVALTWQSLRTDRIEIEIRFPDGHGLEPGNAIRHRGIDIGQVRQIELNESLDQVSVIAELLPSAAAIACDGSRFWIVRPQLDLNGIRGLETAVGAKYIAVVPGGSPLKKFRFDGLATPPPDASQPNGLEIVLRGDERFGVNPGSPVTWRGVEVGTVISSGLSPDASKVDLRIQILDPYRRLLSRDSKFWVTSGFDLDVGLTGVELSAESLVSIARGGIGFITPSAAEPGSEVQPGDVFVLHPQVNQDWIETASAVNLLSRDPPEVGRVEASWKQKSLGFSRSIRVQGSAILVQGDNSAYVLMPADLARVPKEAIDGSFQLTFRDRMTEIPLQPLSLDQLARRGLVDASIADLAKVPLEASLAGSKSALSAERLRLPVGPEDAFAVRRSSDSDDHSAVVIEMIGREQILVQHNVWSLTELNLNREIWHGAAVVACEDERVIGMIVIIDRAPAIIPLSPLHLP